MRHLLQVHISTRFEYHLVVCNMNSCVYEWVGYFAFLCIINYYF